MESKEPIRLRRRKMKSGLTSLYLDIYVKGRRSYEYLRLYLVDEKTRADKEKNKQTLLLADAIRAKRIVELRNGQYGFTGVDESNINFWEYYNVICERIREKMAYSTWRNWLSCLHHLQRYEPRKSFTLMDISPEWVRGFCYYLDQTARNKNGNIRISQNSKMNYYTKLKALIHTAIKEGRITKDPLCGVDNFRTEEVMRMYLTIDEVKTLADTPCRLDDVKKAFLFSCFTGLRRSDILKMTWGEVHQQGEFIRIIFKQKKTGGQEYLDITPQAAELMGERGEPDDPVFIHIASPSHTNEIIKEWVERAGINKKITFHCGRHTFATLMLDLGADLFTVSKLLGHREVKTTQIYAKVIDKNKQEAVSRIPRILPTKDKE